MHYGIFGAFKKIRNCFVFTPFFIVVSVAPSDAEPLHILGWLERVQIAEGGIRLEAKLDSGADHSSLHAPNFQVFERDDEEWIRFRLKGLDDREATFERPLERWASLVGREDDRPVIMLGFCVGNVYREVEVNLTNREKLSHPMLVGRSFLQSGNILLDSNNEFTREPNCKEVMKR